MAKRRILKKEISNAFGILFSDVLICRHLLPETDKSKTEELVMRICQQNDDFICRAHHAPGSENKAEVKKYYRKLYTDLNVELNAIAEEINGQIDLLDKKHEKGV